MAEGKRLPNDKKTLLSGGNYEMYNLDLMRKVFPRIIDEFFEAHSGRRCPRVRDIIPLYFYLLSYVDGEHTRKDGRRSKRFGASFPSRKKIVEDLRIDEDRIKPLVDILVTNGLILETRDHWEGMRRYKWYYVSYCPRVSDDGYLVDENGEKILPDLSLYR